MAKFYARWRIIASILKREEIRLRDPARLEGGNLVSGSSVTDNRVVQTKYIYIYILCFDLIKWEEKIENEGTNRNNELCVVASDARLNLDRPLRPIERKGIDEG